MCVIININVALVMMTDCSIEGSTSISNVIISVNVKISLHEICDHYLVI